MCLLVGAAKIASHIMMTDVPLLSLVANSVWNHCNRVRTIGYLNLEFEGNAIYVSQESHGVGIHKNAVWLELPEECVDFGHELNRKWVVVEGTFNAFDQGHFSLFAGGLFNITRIEVYDMRTESSEVGNQSK